MRKTLAALLLYLGLASAALAQSTFTMPPPAGVWVMGVQVVSTCGAATISAPAVAYLAMNTSGQLCTNASGGGGGGGAVTIANGADTAEGSTTDTPCTFPTTTTACTMVALAKAIVNATNSPIPAGTNAIGSITNTSFGISGTLPAFAATPTFNIGTAPTLTAVGPTAVGSANANPPVVIGGTATGAAGQNVQGLSIVAPSVAPVTATNTAVVVDLRPDSPGIITLGPATPANSVPTVGAGFTYTHITTATTTAAIKTGAGVLHTVCVNTLGTVASTITVDDALTATTPTIAVINSLTLLGCQTYDVAFSTGLTIVTTGTVAPDVTVSWR